MLRDPVTEHYQRVPLLDLQSQYAAIRDEVRAAVDSVLASQRFILGPAVAALEAEVAELAGVPHAVALASGTDALLITLRALGVGPGDAVVTVPYTFFATAGAIANLGARPVFVDIEEASFNMSAEALARFLAQECARGSGPGPLMHARSGAPVKAVIAVHLFGQCCDIEGIVEVAARYGLPVLEDACQAIGARFRGRPAGSFGAAGALSFFPSKNLGGAGDGGMSVTRNRDLADRIRLLRGHGAARKYFHSVIGFNSRLDELQAAILRVKLRYLESWSAARARNASAYDREFERAGLGAWIFPPPVLPHRTHVFNQYVIRSADREALRAFLAGRGIETEVYYPLALHEQECFAPLGYARGSFPQAEAAARTSLALPVYPELPAESLRHVVDSIRAFCREKSRE